MAKSDWKAPYLVKHPVPSILLQSRRDSIAYRSWRTKVLKRDKYTCQMCGCKDRSKLHAHHKEGYAGTLWTAIKVSNGITLCRECHYKHHPWMNKEHTQMSELKPRKTPFTPKVIVRHIAPRPIEDTLHEAIEAWGGRDDGE